MHVYYDPADGQVEYLYTSGPTNSLVPESRGYVHLEVENPVWTERIANWGRDCFLTFESVTGLLQHVTARPTPRPVVGSQRSIDKRLTREATRVKLLKLGLLDEEINTFLGG